MSALYFGITEALTVRRGYEKRYRCQLLTSDVDGNVVPQSLTGFTVTPGLRQTESKDGTAVSGVSPTAPTVDNDTGVFDYLLAQADTPTLIVGKRYWGYVHVAHATITGGKDELIRMLPIEIVA